MQPSVSQSGDTFDGKDRLMKDVFRLLKNSSKVDFLDYKSRHHPPAYPPPHAYQSRYRVAARQNVFSDPPFSRMDLISCRNVLIYLSPVLQKKVIPIFHYALKPNGFLLVGNTEGLLGSGAEIFDLIDRKNKIYRKRLVPSPVTFGLTISAHQTAEGRPEKPQPSNKEDDVAKTPADVQREADRLLLSKYVPSAVVVNEDLDILQSRGRTNRFLELPTGRASLNLLKMARAGLLYELRPDR